MSMQDITNWLAVILRVFDDVVFKHAPLIFDRYLLEAPWPLLAAGVVLQSGGQYQTIGPSFLFTRLNDLKPDMIAEATARAREAAAKFAQDSGAQVGGIRRANQGVFQILARDRVQTIGEPYQLHKVVRVVSTVEYFLEE